MFWFPPALLLTLSSAPGPACGLSLRFAFSPVRAGRSSSQQVPAISTHSGLCESGRKALEWQPSLSGKLWIRVNMAPAQSLVTRALCHADLQSHWSVIILACFSCGIRCLSLRSRQHCCLCSSSCLIFLLGWLEVVAWSETILCSTLPSFLHSMTASSAGIPNDNRSPGYLNSSVFLFTVARNSLAAFTRHSALLAFSLSYLIIFFPFFRSDL